MPENPHDLALPTMLPIDRLFIAKAKQKDGSLFIRGQFIHDQIKVMTPTHQRISGIEEFAEKKMREELWEIAYNDLRSPLCELMLLARRAAMSNPCAYPEVARIEELTKELNELLDWRKQLAAKQEEESK
jgi:hypothetical protein